VLGHVAPRCFDFLLVLVGLRLQEQSAIGSATAPGAFRDNRFGSGLAQHRCLEAGRSLWKRSDSGLCLCNPGLEFLPRFHGLPERGLRGFASCSKALGSANEGIDLAGSNGDDQANSQGSSSLAQARPTRIDATATPAATASVM
jgi:hypothetical protein